MPYIKKEQRPVLDASLEFLIQDICNEGELNYSITRLCKGFLPKFPTYSDLNAVIGVLECAKLELYRRTVVPYEDLKMVENGDV